MNDELKAALRRRLASLMMWGALVAVAVLLIIPVFAGAQQIGRPKVPVLGKIVANGPTKGAFTGVIQTLDRHNNVLEVGSADGTDVAIFPISKKVKVSSIEGRKLKLAALTPGLNVIVTYEQQGGKRTVQEITILTKATTGKKSVNAS
ncbi:MAG TPA: hypothetical protein VGX94_15085 [Terriglobia bacterium]|nr:hypothetical protein [Terriglobia bacterium]